MIPVFLQQEYTGSEVTIPVASQSLGTLAPNYFAGCKSPALTVAQNNYWTPANTKYLYDPTGLSPVALSNAWSRDQEVTTYMRIGYVFLRLASGKAVYFNHNANAGSGSLDIGIVTGWTTGHLPGASGTYTSLYSTSNLDGIASGYQQADTTGLTLTFGVSGFDIYVKCNGVEFLRFTQIYQLAEGQIAIISLGEAQIGFRDTEFRFFVDKILYSRIPLGQFNLLDFGFSSATATGLISSHSTSLVLTGPSPFSVGDSVIVEIGQETGAGARGTIGVGGTWPALSYANATAMNADTSQLDGTWCWLQSTKGTARFSTSTNTWTLTDPNNWYAAVVYPKSLVAKVVAVAGNTVTLDTPSSTGSILANVYFDNWAIFDNLCGQKGAEIFAIMPSNIEVVIPQGSYAFSKMASVISRNDWRLIGSGVAFSTLFSPKGVPSQEVFFNACTNTNGLDSVANFTLRGNARFSGYGLNVTETADVHDQSYPPGVFMQSCTSFIVRNVAVFDVFQDAVGVEYGSNIWAYNCTATLTDGLQRYIQWLFQWSDTTGGGFVDCVVTSPILTAGFEIFRSSGVTMTRPVGNNATFSLNSAGLWYLDSPVCIVGPNTQYNELSFSYRNPIVNVSSNISPPNPTISQGGTIYNMHISMPLPINANKDILPGIIVNADNPNVIVLSDYTSVNTGAAPGLIVMGNYQPPSAAFGAAAVISTGVNTTVLGIRVIGTADSPSGYTNIFCNASGNSIVNCVADTITGNASGCKTNAQWIAGGGR